MHKSVNLFIEKMRLKQVQRFVRNLFSILKKKTECRSFEVNKSKPPKQSKLDRPSNNK